MYLNEVYTFLGDYPNVFVGLAFRLRQIKSRSGLMALPFAGLPGIFP